MIAMNATDVRKEWSSVVDGVIRERPAFIKRTRDKMWLSNIETMEDILAGYQFTVEKYDEEDDSVTLSLIEIDLVENGRTEQEARLRMANSILEYANEYYQNYAYYSKAPNRKAHIPYIFKALIIDDVQRLGDSIICQGGEN